MKQNNEGALLSVVAHSFGTFVIAHLIQENFDIKFHRVIFCGSVVRYGFPFEQFQNRFAQPIVNEVGTRDIWPAMAESITFGYGSAGTYGFRRPLVRDRWHNEAHHGYFLDPLFCKKYWIPFLKNGEVVAGAAAPEPPRIWLQILSIIKIKYLLAIVILTIFTFSYHSRIFSNYLNLGAPSRQPEAAQEAVSVNPRTPKDTNLSFSFQGANSEAVSIVAINGGDKQGIVSSQVTLKLSAPGEGTVVIPLTIPDPGGSPVHVIRSSETSVLNLYAPGDSGSAGTTIPDLFQRPIDVDLSRTSCYMFINFKNDPTAAQITKEIPVRCMDLRSFLNELNNRIRNDNQNRRNG